MNRIDNKRDLERNLSKNRRVLVLFSASWCPFCQDFLPSFGNTLRKHDFDEVLHVLIDDYNNPLWDDYSIESVPTVILFKQGNVSKRLDGKLGRGLNEKQLHEWLRNL